MPVTFQQFFAALREKKLFVTAWTRRSPDLSDGCLASKRNDSSTIIGTIRAGAERGFQTRRTWARSGDGRQGRILFSPELRPIGNENAPVRFRISRRIEVLSEKLYEDRKRRLRDGARRCGEARAAGLV